MDRKPNVLLFVSNVSGFVMAELAELKKVANVHVWERPCGFTEEAKRMHPDIPWHSYYEQDSAEKMLVAMGDFTPDVFLCVSWVMKPALRLAGILKKRGCVTVVLVDTPWRGTIRQYIHLAMSRLTLLPLFDYAWGAGPPQAEYLRRLGFPKERIKTGFACADTDKFSKLTHLDARPWPHVFLYVGRYVTVKNMRRMERSFLKALERVPESDWMLRCIGGGDVLESLWEERTLHPRIEHLGFKPPSEIQEYARDAGCFVLASTSEHWGVVVHEFAAAGLPLVCSTEVKATSVFLKDGCNGYIFNPYDEEEMTDVFCRIMKMDDDSLANMGRRSHELGMSYTPVMWAARVLSFLGGLK